MCPEQAPLPHCATNLALLVSCIFGGHVLQIHTFLAAVGGKFWAAAEFVFDSGRISASCLPALGFLSGFLANHRVSEVVGRILAERGPIGKVYQILVSR